MQALAFPNHSESTIPSRKQTAISEVILSGNMAQAGLTLAMLAHLSHQHKTEAQAGRWLTWICPLNISREALAGYDFDVLGMRILQPKHEQQIPELIQAALSAGTSHTVVAHCAHFNGKLTPWLERAAAKGSCSGLIIRPQ